MTELHAFTARVLTVLAAQRLTETRGGGRSGLGAVQLKRAG
jgi:hypothetical protein